MEYFRPASLTETLSLLNKWKKGARVVAGGTNVIPDLRAKSIKPQALIDLSPLKNLSYVKEEKRDIKVGGMTTISDLASSTAIRKYAPILCEAARQLGNPLVRNRATIAGNLADASPAADTAVPLLVLEATIVTERPGRKRRDIPIDQFFLGPSRTVLKPDELIREVSFRKPDPKAKFGYIKLGLRNAMAISVVSVAIGLEVEIGECKSVRISLGAVAPTPMRAYETEAMLHGKDVTQDLVEACCRTLEREVHPISDVRASAEYRRSMASVLLKRLLQELLSGGTK